MSATLIVSGGAPAPLPPVPPLPPLPPLPAGGVGDDVPHAASTPAAPIAPAPISTARRVAPGTSRSVISVSFRVKTMLMDTPAGGSEFTPDHPKSGDNSDRSIHCHMPMSLVRLPLWRWERART